MQNVSNKFKKTETMKIEAIPNIGIIINGKEFNWGNDRNFLRESLNNLHKEDDNIFEMSDFFDGDTSYDIIQKRDIYENINSTENYFFLNYDEDEKLESIEIHSGINISINNIDLIFEKDINEYLKLFKSIGENYTEIEEGNFLFQNLKITIANSESMGGDGNGLSYFYSSKSIEHLLEE